jgi:hypothetical protein
MDKVYFVIGLSKGGKPTTKGDPTWGAFAWPVASYDNWDAADLHVKLANEHVERFNKRAKKKNRYFDSNDIENPWDGNCYVAPNSRTGYTVSTVPLFVHPDQYVEWAENRRKENELGGGS